MWYSADNSSHNNGNNSITLPPDGKSCLIWKDPDTGKDSGQEEKGTTEDEMVEWHHRLNGHGFGWTLAVGEGQGCLACCRSWGHKELDTNEWLNWTDSEFHHWVLVVGFSEMSFIMLSKFSFVLSLPNFFFLWKAVEFCLMTWSCDLPPLFHECSELHWLNFIYWVSLAFLG